jgi:aminobenzoyl-glutamate utilization protein B
VRDLVRDRWRDLRPEFEAALTELWSNPELPMMEYKSAAYLADWLESHGFDVERGTGGLPTAFTAKYGPTVSPAIGLLAEYDALPGQGNKAVPEYAPTGQVAGHACGHNQIGAANVGAAIAARYAVEELGLLGQVIVVGCPGEEIVYGKVVLQDKGAFDGLDAVFTSHADERNGAVSQPCLAAVHGEFIFSGMSGHTGAPRSHNALEAAELAVQSLERLRAHHFPDASVEHILRNAGLMPNITPAECRLWVYCRHSDYERAWDAYHLVRDAAQAAAKLSGTGFREQFISACRGYLANDVLAEVLLESLEIAGPPQWDQKDSEWMRDLAQSCEPCEHSEHSEHSEPSESDDSFDLDRAISLYTGKVDPYGQDDGEINWRVPLGRVNWAVPRQVPFHSWATTALSGSRAGNAGALMASEALALTTVGLLAEPSILQRSQAQLQARVGAAELTAPRYGAFETLSSHPETFWNATWVGG